MKLQQLDSKKQAELIAVAQGQELINKMELDELDSLWHKEHQQAASEFLTQNNYNAYYRYHDRHGINVSSCWWEREGFDEEQLVLIFGAMYAGNDINLIFDPCKDQHWVYYWVAADGSLTWATDEFVSH